MKTIETLVMGPFLTNTYLVKEDGHCLIIDPASNPRRIMEHVGECKVDAILLTHGHFDHIGAVDTLKKKLNCDIYISKEDEEMIYDAQKNASFMVKPFILESKVRHYHNEHTIHSFHFEVLSTPGHTKGSVCIIMDDFIFCGDTVFKNGVGRCDLYGGSYSQIKNSIVNIKKLEKDYILYPGHDESTTLLSELENNPYFQN